MAARGKRRALGQHFLRDTSVITRIVETALDEASRNGCSTLLEVGPGKGALTSPIREALPRSPGIRRFLLVEKDRELAADWKNSGLEVVEGDFLDVPEATWLESAPVLVVSNLPYSSGTAILTRLARHGNKIPAMVLMFQAEVARRLRAEPGTKDWGSLSIWIQNRWDVRKLCSVPPGAFSPPPEVDSEVVVLHRRLEPRIAVSEQDEPLWGNLLKTCFMHRRQMLRRVKTCQNALELAQVDGTKRAEVLGWEEWERFLRAVLRTERGMKS